MNETEQFLKNITGEEPEKDDLLDGPLVPEPAKEEEPAVEAPETEVEDEGDEFKPKNRREKRLLKKLQEERESSMFLAGKLEAREEAKRVRDEESDYLKAIERIYGTETPEAQLATDLLKKAILGARDEARTLAVEEFRTERQREIQAEKEAKRELEGFIEDIEDTYNVSLTDAQEKSFFQLLQKMSPKDTEGNVVSYADPHAVWEVLQERMSKKGTDSRAKDLSFRSMVQSGAPKESTLQDDAGARILRENGII